MDADVNFATWVLMLHVGSTLAMVGLIWFVQIVHYPLFSQVGADNFRRYEMEHQRLTAYVVAPLMLLELGTAILLFWYRPFGIAAMPAWLGLMLVVAVWLLTYCVQVPQHASLVMSYNMDIQRKLVAGNWYRTAAWTARGVLVLWMASQTIAAGNSPTDVVGLHAIEPY